MFPRPFTIRNNCAITDLKTFGKFIRIDLTEVLSNRKRSVLAVPRERERFMKTFSVGDIVCDIRISDGYMADMSKPKWIPRRR